MFCPSLLCLTIWEELDEFGSRANHSQGWLSSFEQSVRCISYLFSFPFAVHGTSPASLNLTDIDTIDQVFFHYPVVEVRRIKEENIYYKSYIFDSYSSYSISRKSIDILSSGRKSISVILFLLNLATGLAELPRQKGTCGIARKSRIPSRGSTIHDCGKIRSVGVMRYWAAYVVTHAISYRAAIPREKFRSAAPALHKH